LLWLILLLSKQAIAQKAQIGINIEHSCYYCSDFVFADAFKDSRNKWEYGCFNCNLVPLNAQGWPLQDANVIVAKQSNLHGTYKLYLTGQAVVKVSGIAGTVANPVYDPATNTTTADVIVTDPEEKTFILDLTKTRRTPTSPLNSGVTNIRLMRPIKPGATSSYPPDTTFTDQFKTYLDRFSVIRLMDYLATNGNLQEKWSDRTLPDYATNAGPPAPGYGWQGRGGALEHAIQLANQTGKDLWLNIPARADDDYVRQVAKLFNNNLNPDRKLYIEYSNEVWNSLFAQYKHNIDLAKAEVAKGSPLNYDGTSSEFTLGMRRVANRLLEISNIFRAEFGDCQMMSRVRPVLMWQYGDANNTGTTGLDFIDNYYNNGDGIKHVATPHPVNYYFWGGGGGAYSTLNKIDGNSVDAMYDSGLNTKFANSIKKDVAMARAYGLYDAAYEGGFQMGGNILGGVSNETATTKAANIDPRSKGAEVSTHQLAQQAGLDLFMVFTSAGTGPWSRAIPNVYTDEPNRGVNAPKLQAIDQLNAAGKQTITNCHVVAGAGVTTIAGNQPQFQKNVFSYNLPTLNGNTARYNVYLLRTDKAGYYAVSMNLSNSKPDGQMSAFINGAPFGKTITVPVSAQSVVVDTVFLQVGLHGLRVQAIKSGTGVLPAGSINSISVAPAPAPTGKKPVQLLTPTDQQQFEAGATVVFTTDAATAGRKIVKQEFYQGNVKLGEVASCTASAFSWPQVPAGVYKVKVVATDEQGTLTQSKANTILVGADFTLAATPGTLSIQAGASKTGEVTVNALHGFADQVWLAVSSLPTGVTASFDAASLTGSGKSTLTLQVAATVSAGTYNLIIGGTSGAKTRQVILVLTITGALPAADFTLQNLTPAVGVVAGGSGKATVAVTASGGFAESVALSAINLPPGVSALFSPATVTGSGQSTLTLQVDANAAAGSYPVVIRGSNNGKTKETALALTVARPPAVADFSLQSPDSTLGVTIGGKVSTTIEVTASGGFAESVALSAINLPPGVSAVFSAPALRGTGSATLTFEAAGGTATGTTLVTIRGVGGSATKEITIALTVSATPSPAGFALQAPATLTVTAGNSANMVVQVIITGGLAEQVVLSAINLPVGITGVFSPATVTGSGQSTLTLQAAPNAKQGSHAVSIRGTSGGATKETNLDLMVVPPVVSQPTGSFTITSTAAELMLTAAGTATATVNVVPTAGFSSPVSLSVSGLPAGMAATFNPATVTAGGNSTVSIVATGPVPTSPVRVKITATDGITNRELIITILPAGPVAIANDLRPRNAFSPNGDPDNQYWEIVNIEHHPDATVTIYDQTGRKVFEQKGYANRWEGVLNGRPLPEGVYYYVISYYPLSQPGGRMSKTGSITLVR
jgi:gliding motility-associated-like protein